MPVGRKFHHFLIDLAQLGTERLMRLAVFLDGLLHRVQGFFFGFDFVTDRVHLTLNLRSRRTLWHLFQTLFKFGIFSFKTLDVLLLVFDVLFGDVGHQVESSTQSLDRLCGVGDFPFYLFGTFSNLVYIHCRLKVQTAVSSCHIT